MAFRLDISSLESNQTAIDVLRDTYTALKQVPDERGFDWFAALHGLPAPAWCEHGSLLFLPWHRAFLYYYEQALQTRLGPRLTETVPRNPAFGDIGLPWWDWASARSHDIGLPASYAAPQASGQPNPLFSSEIAACPGGAQVSGVWSASLINLLRTNAPGLITDNGPPVTLRDPPAPDDLPRQSTLDNLVLTQTTFSDFSTSMEQVHNDIHGWVGGAMSLVPTSAYDPIFWSHHCMIDRLWYIWQIGPNGANPPADMMDTVLAPFPMTVAQVLDIDRLGYDYAVAAIA